MDSAPKNEENEIEKLSRKIPALSDYTASLGSQVNNRLAYDRQIVTPGFGAHKGDKPWQKRQLAPGSCRQTIGSDQRGTGRYCYVTFIA